MNHFSLIFSFTRPNHFDGLADDGRLVTPTPSGRPRGLGQVRIGVEIGMDILGFQVQPLDGRRPERAGALGVEGGGVLLAEQGLLAVTGAAQAGAE